MGVIQVTALSQGAVENLIVTFLESTGGDYTRDNIRTAIDRCAGTFGWGAEEAKDQLQKSLEAKLTIRMSLGSMVSEKFQPWLDARKASINPFFWDRYAKFLVSSGFPPTVVARLNHITDKILGTLEDPERKGNWYRRGLVMGHVQSGKTANYIGLINKAADAGYRLVILIAGTLNNLRTQTQERVDEGFIGRDSSQFLNAKQKDVLLGVGLRDSSRFPVTFTNTESDFRKATARILGISPGQVKEPVILVVKKNTSTLENLLDWLKQHNAGAGAARTSEMPLLLIDDEADYASINTKDDGTDPTRTNKLIREILAFFHRRCYVGYTATPFANIFIDPESTDEMLGDDLFPKDFIYSLEPPSNYFSPIKLFSDPPELNVVQECADYDGFLPLNHKIHARPQELPESLLHAIRCFVLVRSVRLVRGQVRKHNSMLVNVSRFTGVQSHVRDLIDVYLEKLKDAVRFNYKLSWERASKNEHMRSLRESWEHEFVAAPETWDVVQGELQEAAAPIKVEEVNVRASGAAALNYKRNKETGLNVIAVGGLSLSRGFTLEGLSISYLIRNTQMYDTLLQMGRWFGYRDGYEDLCRLYMPSDAIGWYAHVTEAAEELREELKRMEAAGLTPKDFGLKVRAHPDTLIVTARNKMRKAETVYWQVELANRLVETTKLFAEPRVNELNIDKITALVTDLVSKHGMPRKIVGNLLWQGVERTDVCRFVSAFQNHPASINTHTEAVVAYCSSTANTELEEWDVALMGLDSKEPQAEYVQQIGPFRVECQERAVSEFSEMSPKALSVSGRKSRVASRGAERLGLTDPEIDAAVKAFDPEGQAKNIPDRAYRAVRRKPLLMLHLLRTKDGKARLGAYGISFPPAPAGRGVILTKYAVNPVWWNEQFQFESEEEADGESQSVA